MASADRNKDTDWLGYLQPVGLVVAPRVLAALGLTPPQQTAVDTEAIKELLAEAGPALSEPWVLFEQVLGWPAAMVAGGPGGPPLPDELHLPLTESDTLLEPHWAVAKPDGDGWQLLVRLEGAGIAPDARGVLPGWEATPHQRFERLLRETGVFTGLLLTDDELRLIHAPRGETSGWLGFPLRQLGTVAGRPMLAGLKLLLDARRLFTDAPEARLPAVLEASRRAQAEVSSRLATQVLGALHELLRGFHAADPAAIGAVALSRPEHLYEGLLTVLLRLVFLLYAEDRDLIPSRTDRAARDFYDQGYGVRTLHAMLLEDAARNPDTMDERRGAWGRLLALFRLVHAGEKSGWIRARGGKLFDPAEFPFLEGRFAPDDAPRVPDVRDGTLLRVLDGLLTLDGERLSYRTLDVEQIGSVYETVMGFTVAVAAGPALAIKVKANAKSRHYTPVFVDLRALLGEGNRLRWLADNTDRGKFPPKVEAAIKAAADETGLTAALGPVVDERGSPRAQVAPPGTPLLQPTHERRRTGSHYTPRELTEPIVRHALAPAFERLGEAATADAVLALKVCDPAMGSGAFLVEACRQLAARLVRAWARHPGTRPEIAADEDEELLARRLVAQRCLYGVDKNPMAADLARLSLWLATLARDHEFTFLDHALRSGDSLVGLTRAQIGALRWDDEPAQGSLFTGFVRERVAEALRRREDIRAAPDDVERAVQERRYAMIERPLAEARLIGDAVVAAFFAGGKPRERETQRRKLEDAAMRSPQAAWQAMRDLAPALGRGANPVRPFHWELEFPEVFSGDNPGFDAIVGNPPFLSGSKTSQGFGATYFQYLLTRFDGAKHQCDYVAFFFRLAFDLLMMGGVAGLIGTKTIAQGDTRESGLEIAVAEGAQIIRVLRRLLWPGEASVIVSTVHFGKHTNREDCRIDNGRVSRISAYLVAGKVDAPPVSLASNPYFSKGSQIYGQGFVFDAADKSANNPSLLEPIKANPLENAYIYPMYGGIDINQMPSLEPTRWVINVSNLDEDQVEQLTNISAIMRSKVKLGRDALPDNSNNKPLKRRWWAYQAHRPELYERFSRHERFLAHAEISPHLGFRFVDTRAIYIKTVILFEIIAESGFAVLQSRVHELWARFFASSMKDDLRYTPSDCFETFPFCAGYETDPVLQEAGRAYHDHRAALMIARNEGLTKTYNRFHDRGETAADIVRLRELHDGMDRAVLRAYGWNDLADQARPEFLTEETEPDHRWQNRLFWPAPFRDEVLARLLALNAERAAAEKTAGLSPARRRENEIEEVVL